MEKRKKPTREEMLASMERSERTLRKLREMIAKIDAELAAKRAAEAQPDQP